MAEYHVWVHIERETPIVGPEEVAYEDVDLSCTIDELGEIGG